MDIDHYKLLSSLLGCLIPATAPEMSKAAPEVSDTSSILHLLFGGSLVHLTDGSLSDAAATEAGHLVIICLLAGWLVVNLAGDWPMVLDKKLIRPYSIIVLAHAIQLITRQRFANQGRRFHWVSER